MSALDRLRWYRNRLAAMSAAEVAHRIVEQGKRTWSRYHRPHFPDDAPDGFPGLPGLSEALRREPLPAALLDDWREVAARARAGRFRFLGRDWPEGGAAPAWHLDPVTRRSWPADRYCFAIAHRHAADLGDVKYVWELNRLQYLQPVAALAAAEGDAASAALVARHVQSWIDANPPFLGVAWSSGIELALRVVSLLVVGALVPEAFSAEQKCKLWRALAAHGYWLMRYPSRFSSANNHV
ncbi:MAG: heparinase, partial [Rhodospirillaceae bacterium]|nr:heparinase [Rhodospirillaceae bacterium]